MHFEEAWNHVQRLNGMIGVVPEVRADGDRLRVRERSNGNVEVSEDGGETTTEMRSEELATWLAAHHRMDWE